MNLLAHAYLSFDQPEILIGNMISDYVKGNKQFDYSPTIHKGILLHRRIDDFTDTHDTTKKLKSFFKDDYRLYACAMGDVAYDYFVANDVDNFSTDQILQDFSVGVTVILDKYLDILPPNFQRLVPYLKKDNWLYNYKFTEGIKNSFAGVVRRAKYINDAETAFKIFQERKEDIQLCYNEFFPQLKLYAAEQLAQLNKIE